MNIDKRQEIRKAFAKKRQDKIDQFSREELEEYIHETQALVLAQAHGLLSNV